MTSPVVSGAQGDGGLMDDETLDDRDWFTSRAWIGAGVSSDECEPITECRSVSQAEEIVRDHNALAGALRAARRELGDTRAENDELRDTLGDRTRHNDRLIRAARRLDAELIAGLSTDEHQMTMLAGLPTCRCGFPLGGGDATGKFITHALERLEDTRARLAAVEALAEEWRKVTPAGFYPEASAHANAVENCGDALIDLLSEPAAALGATDQAGDGG